ncbi:MAG: 1,2-phenylacetyl-CoA epoxidase subunit PaaC [Bacteroidota bacterium]
MSKLYDYILLLGDNSLILGHRLSELCGHGPNLETDIALTNISLDCYGQVRNYFQYAAKLADDGKTEDDIAFLRNERQYTNVLLLEQPNTDFAHVIARQFLFDVYQLALVKQLLNSKDETISAIANKAIKEVSYHERFSSEWVKRLGDGTEISHSKMQDAINHLYPFVGELFDESELEKNMREEGIGGDIKTIEKPYFERVDGLLKEATLEIPEKKWRRCNGKKGMHSENMGYILSELQYMQRAYPNMEW